MGWHLLAGLMIFAIMTLLVGEIGERVASGHPLTVTDAKLSAWLYANRSPSLTRALRIATELGSTWIAIATAGVFGIYLLWRRQIYWLVVVWFSVFGGMGLNRLLKYAFQRPRPHFDDPLLSLTGYSFPSGHTMAATVLYGVVAVFLVARTKHLAARAIVILSAAALIAIVGFSRIYLGAHYLSDVLGAIAEGLAWLSLCFTFMYSYCHNRNDRPV